MLAKKWLSIGFGLMISLAFGCGDKKESYRYEDSFSSCHGIADKKIFKLSWEAVKANGQKIKGEIMAKGIMEPGPDGSLASALFELEFDVFSINSHIPLRNERIWNFFFKADAFPVIEYKGSIVKTDNPAFPGAGEKRRVEIKGFLSLAGQRITVTLYAEVVNDGGVVYVRESAERPSVIDVRSTAVLSTNIDQMLHAAGVDGMQRAVVLSGVMPILQPCSGP